MAQPGGSEGWPGGLRSAGIDRFVLTGFMGAGKSTVGALLAARLGWQFVDVDAAIEARYGASIAVLFERHGEAWFREVERAAIAELLGMEHVVMALGGGAIEAEATLEALLSSPGTRLVHLEATLATVLERCGGTEATRPILRDKVNLESRYARRLPLYRRAHVTVAVDALEARAVAELLAAQVEG